MLVSKVYIYYIVWKPFLDSKCATEIGKSHHYILGESYVGVDSS